MMTQEFKTVSVMFAMNHTIEAILRLHNPKVEKGQQLQELVKLFNQVNNNQIPTLGKRYEIPKLEKYQIFTN